jgi:hypothetical protein
MVEPKITQRKENTTMGKIKLVIGGLLVIGTGIATVLGLRKKEDERSKKIDKIIQDVDLKKKPEVVKVKTNEEIIDEALEAMEIGDEEMTQVTNEKTDILNKVLKDDEKLQSMAEHVHKMQNDPEYLEKITKEKEAERRNRFETGEWMEDVEKAKKAKNYSKLEDLFNEKYNPYPYHPAPAGPFGSAHMDGYIDDKLYDAIRKYYGRLWDYSGD